MRRGIAPLFLALAWAGRTVAAVEPETYRLENGLTVILRPVAFAKDAALVVLFDVGADHDPEGRSGLGHLVEHVYVTAAAGEEPARTIVEYVKRHPKGWNAQTGERYTVIATVFPAADLDRELTDAAARMGDLRVTAADLDREKPRLLDEVANMFGRIPWLGASNNARELLRPTPLGGRRGGLPEHVQAINLNDVQQHVKTYYKPRNAVLVLAGGFDAKPAHESIAARFATLPTGEKAPAPAERGKPNYGAVGELAVKPIVENASPEACLAYAPPDPKSALYAPFLVLFNRLNDGARKLGGGPGRFPVTFAMLDDPTSLQVGAPALPGESARQALARLEKFVAETIAPKLGKNEVPATKQALGYFLGIAPLPDFMIAANPYTLAFSIGRGHQLGIEPAKLDKALQAVTDEDLRRAAQEIFGPDRHAGALVTIEKE